MNYKLNRDRLLKLLVGELKALLAEVSDCDHAKGICRCSAKELVKKTEELMQAKRKII